jgi:hypothetical protein
MVREVSMMQQKIVNFVTYTCNYFILKTQNHLCENSDAVENTHILGERPATVLITPNRRLQKEVRLICSDSENGIARQDPSGSHHYYKNYFIE